MARNPGPAVHNISFCGLTGLIFALLTSALVLYLEGFVTSAWSVTNSSYVGLWQTCSTEGRPPASAWLLSTQVLTSVGLFGLLVAFGLTAVYMSANRASKNLTLVYLTALALVAGVVICTSVSLYGLYVHEEGLLSWSYYVTVAAGVLCLLAGLLSIAQIRRSNVRL